MSGTDYVLTPNLGLYKPLPTADINAWGGHLNSNADILDTALHTAQTGAPFLPLTGGTMTGPLFLATNATQPMQPVPLQQMNAGAGYTLMQGSQPAGGFTSSPYPFGTSNEATAFSCNIWPPDASGRPTMPGVLGIWNASGVANYSSRDMVTFYAGAHSAAPTTITVASANYTATTMVPSPPLTVPQVTFIQQAIAINNQRAPLIPAGFDNVGMMIDTQHATKYTGNITAVAADGSSVTVQGWFQMGNQSAGQVPPGGVGAYVNPCTHMWNMNGIQYLAAGTMCQEMTFLEIDTYNYQTAFNGSTAIIPTIGISANHHANTGGYAFLALGNWYSGFVAKGNTSFGYLINPNINSPGQTDMPFGFVSQVRSDIVGGHHPFAYWDFATGGGGYRWSVNGSGGMNLGNPAVDNGIGISTALTGGTPTIQAAGVDTNINLTIRAKGTGAVDVLSALVVTLAGAVCSAPVMQTYQTNGPTWTGGPGAPSTTQPIGSMYSRIDGGTGARLYVSAGGGDMDSTTRSVTRQDMAREIARNYLVLSREYYRADMVARAEEAAREARAWMTRAEAKTDTGV